MAKRATQPKAEKKEKPQKSKKYFNFRGKEDQS